MYPFPWPMRVIFCHWFRHTLLSIFSDSARDKRNNWWPSYRTLMSSKPTAVATMIGSSFFRVSLHGMAVQWPSMSTSEVHFFKSWCNLCLEIRYLQYIGLCWWHRPSARAWSFSWLFGKEVALEMRCFHILLVWSSVHNSVGSWFLASWALPYVIASQAKADWICSRHSWSF